MKRKETLLAVSLTGLLVLSLTQGAAAQAPQELGMLEVSVQVDGLSCPFCAYGLEKKLRKVENVARIEIRVDEGRAVITPESGTSLELDELEQAVRDGASAVILCHNHPSGDPEPSPDDIDLTKRLCESGALLGIRVLDHVIFGDGRFVSLSERGLM